MSRRLKLLYRKSVKSQIYVLQSFSTFKFVYDGVYVVRRLLHYLGFHHISNYYLLFSHFHLFIKN